MEELSAEYEEKERQEILSVGEARRYRRTMKAMEDCRRSLGEETISEPENVWEWMRQWFGRQSDEYEEMKETGGQMLEHAFDFMEAAFGTGQEMVLFVTELNSNFYCVEFLQEYDCARYYEYNKSLLFDDREDEILRKIGNL